MAWGNVRNKNMTGLKIDWILFHFHLAVKLKVETFPKNLYHMQGPLLGRKLHVYKDKY